MKDGVGDREGDEAPTTGKVRLGLHLRHLAGGGGVLQGSMGQNQGPGLVQAKSP